MRKPSAEDAEMRQELVGGFDDAAQGTDRLGHLSEIGRRQAGARVYELVASSFSPPNTVSLGPVVGED